MSLYHLSAQIISRADGRSVVNAAAYRRRAAFLDVRRELTFDWTGKDDLFDCLILAPESMGDWVKDSAGFWNTLEQFEKRKDAQLAREIEGSLPVELDADARRALAVNWADQQFVANGHMVDISFHGFKTGNPHFHLLHSLRFVEGDSFQREKVRRSRAELDAEIRRLRESWADATNAALLEAGLSHTVDHRTLKVQRAEALERGELERAEELNYAPTMHLGVERSQRIKEGRANLSDAFLLEALERQAARRRHLDMIARRKQRRKEEREDEREAVTRKRHQARIESRDDGERDRDARDRSNGSITYAAQYKAKLLQLDPETESIFADLIRFVDRQPNHTRVFMNSGDRLTITGERTLISGTNAATLELAVAKFRLDGHETVRITGFDEVTRNLVADQLAVAGIVVANEELQSPERRTMVEAARSGVVNQRFYANALAASL